MIHSSSIKTLSTDEFLQRVVVQTAAQSNSIVSWTGLVIPDSAKDEAIEELQDSFPIFTDMNLKVTSAEKSVPELINAIQNVSTGYILVRDFKGWTEQDWQTLDHLRGKLEAESHGTLFILSMKTLEIMLRHAPNFSSWFGSRIYQLVLDQEYLSEEDCERRLANLREWSGRSDNEVIQLAETHQLPSDPEYGEWLVLLQRGDLIG